VLVKPRFVFPGKSSYGGRDHFHVEISVEVGVPDIPGRIYYVPYHFVLEALNHCNGALCCTSPELDAVGPYWF